MYKPPFSVYYIGVYSGTLYSTICPAVYHGTLSLFFTLYVRKIFGFNLKTNLSKEINGNYLHESLETVEMWRNEFMLVF